MNQNQDISKQSKDDLLKYIESLREYVIILRNLTITEEKLNFSDLDKVKQGIEKIYLHVRDTI